MTGPIHTSSEQHRRECEARTWLRQGYTSRAAVDELVARIAERRGAEAADELRQEMRRQWKLRDQWPPVPGA